jgi:hypothetical protein
MRNRHAYDYGDDERGERQSFDEYGPTPADLDAMRDTRPVERDGDGFVLSPNRHAVPERPDDRPF